MSHNDVCVYISVWLYSCLPPWIASRLELCVCSKQALECKFFFHLSIDFENSFISPIFMILDEDLNDLYILVHNTPEHCNYSSISEWIHWWEAKWRHPAEKNLFLCAQSPANVSGSFQISSTHCPHWLLCHSRLDHFFHVYLLPMEVLMRTLTVCDAAGRFSAVPSRPSPRLGAHTDHPTRNDTKSGRKCPFSFLSNWSHFSRPLPTHFHSTPCPPTFMNSLTCSSSFRKSLQSNIHCDTRCSTFRFLSSASFLSSFPLHRLLQ